MSSNRISVLLNWCVDNGIQIDPRIQVVESSDVDHHSDDSDSLVTDKASSKCGLAVYSCEELSEYPCTLVYIPKTAVLSVKSCSQGISSIPHGHGAPLSLSLALYSELSRWFGYLQSLPRETVDIAMFWGANDVITTGPCTCSSRGCSNVDCDPVREDSYHTPDAQCSACARSHDGQNAKAWLEVTEAYREQVGLVDEIRQYYFDVVEPTLRAVFNNPGQKEDDLSVNRRLEEAEVHNTDGNPRLHGASLYGFCHAYSLVSTRAFSVDAYHGLAMVPIADAFNHTNENHLHMESDYDVCVECGSLAECEHDRELESHIAPHALAPNLHPLSQINASSSNEIDYLEMRTVRPVPPHTELFNTYGTLSNAALLSRYGFTLPENEHDTVRMVFDPLTSVANMFVYARKDPLVDDDAGHGAVMQTFDLAHLAVRNRLREGVSADCSGAATEPYDKEQRTRGRGPRDDDLPIPSSSVYDDKTSEGLPICNEESADMNQKDVANRLLRMFACMSRVWSAEAAWDEHDDGLVFNPEPGRPVSFLLADGPVQVNHDLVINSDGKISHNLWLLCALIALFSTPSHLDPAFFGVLQWAENGCESIAALTELKERLVHIQRYIERLRHVHDLESVGDDMDDSNHGSTSLSHPAPSLPNMNYDPESARFAQPTTALQLQPRPSLDPKDTFTCLPIAAAHGSRTPPGASRPKSTMGGLLGTGPQDPRISLSPFSLPAPQPLSESFQIPAMLPPSQIHAAGHSYQETTQTVTIIHPPKATVSSSRRNHSCSSEGERPPKRVRRFSDDSAVVPQGGSRSNKLSRVAVEGVSERHLLDTPEGDAGITDHHTALLLARVVVGLCYGRYRPPMVRNGQRGIGMTGAELGELFDETPESMPRTRSALLLAMSERSIVESCAASWGAILEK